MGRHLRARKEEYAVIVALLKEFVMSGLKVRESFEGHEMLALQNEVFHEDDLLKADVTDRFVLSVRTGRLHVKEYRCPCDANPRHPHVSDSDSSRIVMREQVTFYGMREIGVSEPNGHTVVFVAKAE
jgi:hypothetical protein